MLKSMTAFGRGEYELNNKLFTIEIKSLNNRYKDIIIKSSKMLQPIEEEIKGQVSSGVKRGRIELSIQIENKGDEPDYAVDLNIPMVKTYLNIFKQLKNDFGLDDTITAEFISQKKDVISIRPKDVDLEEIGSGIQEALSQALEVLVAMRLQEGKAIEADFQKRLSFIEKQVDIIENRAPVVIEEYKQKLKDRIEKLAQDIELDETRLAQEVAIFAGRCDITEEIVRTKSHLNQFRQYIELDDSVGRRLDFLTQEINREINTISSKASDASISSTAVEIKAELEKLREQVQNIE